MDFSARDSRVQEYISRDDFRSLPPHELIPASPHHIPVRDMNTAAQKSSPAATHSAQAPCREWELIFRASAVEQRATALPYMDVADAAGLPPLAPPRQFFPRTSQPRGPQSAPRRRDH